MRKPMGQATKSVQPISDPVRFLYKSEPVVRNFCKASAIGANNSHRSYEQLGKDLSIPFDVRRMFRIFANMERDERVADLKAGFEARERELQESRS